MNPGDSATRQEVRLGGPPLGPGGEDLTWPDQVAPRGRKESSTRKIKPETSNPHTQSNALSGHTGEQEPSGPGHRTRNTAHRAGTQVNRSQLAKDTAPSKQHTEGAHH